MLKTNIAIKSKTENPRKLNPTVTPIKVQRDDVADKVSFCDKFYLLQKFNIRKTTILNTVRVIGKQSNVPKYNFLIKSYSV